MNVLDATRAWMRAQCPLINRQDLFNANYLGAEPTEYTLRTASESTAPTCWGMTWPNTI
mgnify:CR=1 FL=1